MQTDHVPLRHLPNQASVNSRIWKWINILQGYDLELHHILRKKNQLARCNISILLKPIHSDWKWRKKEKDLVSVLRIEVCGGPKSKNGKGQERVLKVVLWPVLGQTKVLLWSTSSVPKNHSRNTSSCELNRKPWMMIFKAPYLEFLLVKM